MRSLRYLWQQSSCWWEWRRNKKRPPSSIHESATSNHGFIRFGFTLQNYRKTNQYDSIDKYNCEEKCLCSRRYFRLWNFLPEDQW